MMRFLALTAASVLTVACSRSGSGIDEMTDTKVTFPNGTVISCQTMVRDLDLTRGMMFQDSLSQNRGMILMYPTAANRPVFTYNVRIPLDFIWIDQGQKIVEVVEKVPPCASSSAKQCPTYGGRSRSRYILEINAGQAAAQGLKVGDKLLF